MFNWDTRLAFRQLLVFLLIYPIFHNTHAVAMLAAEVVRCLDFNHHIGNR